MDVLTPAKIDKAYERIQSLIIKTPLISNETINKKVNANVYFKLENLQRTGSFKIRGASNKISQLSNKKKIQRSGSLLIWKSCSSSSICIKYL